MSFEVSREALPLHVAIIPDGNRRWAASRLLPPAQGHHAGYVRTKGLIEEARRLGIQTLTFWAFSTENWSRSSEEVSTLLTLIKKAIEELGEELSRTQARFVHIGRKDRLSQPLLSLITSLEESTKEYAEFCLCLALDYGGEDEINRAVARLEASSPESPRMLKDFLDTSVYGVSSPDFVIRTSGEKRTSGFMPLQTAYSEWYFEDVLFPDFSNDHFQKALFEYTKRKRRFGK